MAPHARAAEPWIFYGWWVAVAFSLIIFLSTGIRFAVGPFLKPVVGDLGIDRGTFSLVVSLSLFLLELLHRRSANLPSAQTILLPPLDQIWRKFPESGPRRRHCSSRPWVRQLQQRAHRSSLRAMDRR